MAPSREEAGIGQRIAQNLQALLRARGLTQGQLAYKAGMTPSGISNLVNGRKNPSFLSVVKVARALAVQPEDLAGFKPLRLPVEPKTETDRLLTLERRVDELAAQLPPILTGAAEALEAQEASTSESRRQVGGKRSRR